MKKRKILSFILSMSIISNLILSTTNVYATTLNESDVSNNENVVSTSDESEIANNENVVSTSDSLEKEDKVLGTIKELFPLEWLQSTIIWELKFSGSISGNVTEETSVTQQDLDKITELTTTASGELLHFPKEGIKNLNLLRNLKIFKTQSAPKFDSSEDMEYFWNKIGELEKLEELSLNFNFRGGYGNGVNKNYIINIPYLPNLKKLSLSWMGAEKSDPSSVGPGYIFDGSSLNKNNLPVIEDLVLDVVPLYSYESIGTLDTLTKLNVSNNGSAIKDIDFIKNLINLQTLNISSCSISDFTPLNNLPNLTNVRATNQRILNIKENSINYYYEESNEAILPAKIILPDGTNVNNQYFSDFTPVKSIFDNSNSTIKIDNLMSDDLKQNVKIYDRKVNPNTNQLEPYIANNIAEVTFSIPDFNLINGAKANISGKLVYEINFKAGVQQYEVIYDSNGGTPIASEKVKYNDLISKPEDPTKEGYIFAGWYKEESLNTPWDFKTDRMPSNNLTLYAKWILKSSTLNHIPTINATDKVLTVGDSFNPLDGVSAFDEEDKNIALSEANIISNNVDMSQAGTYSITYKVTDSHGASAIKTITVIVNPKLEVVKPENNNPTVESKPEVDNKPTDTTIENTTNKLPNTGIESSLPLLGALSLTIGTALSLKKKQK